MSTLNARIGRTLPSPALMLIRHHIVVRNNAKNRQPMRVSSPYVGALLVAGALLLLGSSIISSPRPAADPSCRAESAR